MKDALGHGSDSNGGGASASRMQRFVTNAVVSAEDRRKWMGVVHQSGVLRATERPQGVTVDRTFGRNGRKQ